MVPASSPLASAGSLKVICGSITKMGWGTIMHEPHVLSNIQQDSTQYLWQTVLKKYQQA
jgi:hypothetical protein